MHRQRQKYDKKNNQITSKTAHGKCLKEMKKATAGTGTKLLAHFASAVCNEDTGQMLEHKQLINHNKKEIREWWQRSLADEFGKLMKGAGRNVDITQRGSQLKSITNIIEI